VADGAGTGALAARDSNGGVEQSTWGGRDILGTHGNRGSLGGEGTHAHPLGPEKNLVSLDITHCLQRPSQRQPDGSVRAGGDRELAPWMGRLGMALGVDGLFVEVSRHQAPQ
jgi:hypothetical protein